MNHRKILSLGLALFAFVLGFEILKSPASALSVSPMKEQYSLIPGGSATGRVSASTYASDTVNTYYEVMIAPFTVNNDNNDYSIILDDYGSDYTNIVNWVTISDADETVTGKDGVLKGKIEPGKQVDFIYKIDVPENARGGGQDFAVWVKSVPNPDGTIEGNVGIQEQITIASVVYVEIAGDINRSGAIRENNISTIFLNPPISASFIAENKGNTHAEITYSMQVFPLFSNEEIYTNEENPETKLVLPGTTRFISQSWDKTPAIGIFRVVQTVYYGSTDSTPSISEKTVIIAPLWFIFLVLLIVFAAIFWLISRIVRRKKTAE